MHNQKTFVHLKLSDKIPTCNVEQNCCMAGYLVGRKNNE